MITCPHCDDWRGFTSDLPEHEYTEHGLGNWGGPDCSYCGGEGEYLASRTPNRFGDEDWRTCPKCRGTGVTDGR